MDDNQAEANNINLINIIFYFTKKVAVAKQIIKIFHNL